MQNLSQTQLFKCRQCTSQTSQNNILHCSICNITVCNACIPKTSQKKINPPCPKCKQPIDKKSSKLRIKMLKKPAYQKQKEKITKIDYKKAVKLDQVRVIQKNLVYLIGVSPEIANQQVLVRDEYLGQYGKIQKVIINKKNAYQGRGYPGPCYGVYVTFLNSKSSSIAILNMDQYFYDGRIIRASYGTTKYCTYFLKNKSCTNKNCLYLHEICNDSQMIAKDEIAAKTFCIHQQHMALKLSGALYKTETQFSEQFRKYRKKPPSKSGLYRCEFPAPHYIYSKELKSINGMTLTDYHLEKESKQRVKSNRSSSGGNSSSRGDQNYSSDDNNDDDDDEEDEYQIQTQQNSSEIISKQIIEDKKRKYLQCEKERELASNKKDDISKLKKSSVEDKIKDNKASTNPNSSAKSTRLIKSSSPHAQQQQQPTKQKKEKQQENIKNHQEERSTSSLQTVATTPQRTQKSVKQPSTQQHQKLSDFNPYKSMSRFTFARNSDQINSKNNQNSKTNDNSKQQQQRQKLQEQELPILVPQVIKEKLVSQVQQTRNEKSQLIMKVFQMSNPIRQAKLQRQQNKVRQNNNSSNNKSSLQKKKISQNKMFKCIQQQESKCAKYKDDNDLVQSLFKLDWDSYNQQNLDFRTPPINSTKKAFNSSSSTSSSSTTNTQGFKQLAFKKVTHNVKGAKLFPTQQQGQISLNAQPLIILNPSANIWGRIKQNKQKKETTTSHEDILKQIIEKKIIQTTTQQGNRDFNSSQLQSIRSESNMSKKSR